VSNASEAISERTKAALAAAKAPGKRLGTPARASRRGTLAPLFVSNHVSVCENGLASAPPFLLWPSLQNARSLPDRYPDPRPVLDSVGKDFLRLAKIIAGMKQAIDSHAIPCPLLDLVEVADVRNQRVVGFFVWLVVHVRRTSSHGMFRYIQRNPTVIPVHSNDKDEKTQFRLSSSSFATR
jgi:hypothetical protein